MQEVGLVGSPGLRTPGIEEIFAGVFRQGDGGIVGNGLQKRH